jgi:hypothetical protein
MSMGQSAQKNPYKNSENQGQILSFGQIIVVQNFTSSNCFPSKNYLL